MRKVKALQEATLKFKIFLIIYTTASTDLNSSHHEDDAILEKYEIGMNLFEYHQTTGGVDIDKVKSIG